MPICLFYKAKEYPKPPKLYRRPIPWRDETKYLGVILDKRLTYKTHVAEVKNKVTAVNKKLYYVIGKNSKLSLRNTFLLYKTLMRPIMNYASPVWGAAAKSHINKLETAQNKIARQITQVPWYVRNKQIQKELKLTPLLDYLRKLAIKFFSNIDNSTNTDIAEIPRYDPSEPIKRKRQRTLLG
ncbi:putative RNA-directed DNA polymerase from transposon X-element [Araneus ventricosus]|uniref:Putative RNA-directed DNA polymerase from transposon X-element n=1 Tax=Araneus ventricosus TaxID=182803 RepID=A0A4Y2ULZ2_ARAVE|nr:putative RNA-directed DNA polymerase from transposon X-element [Araneus ventricosus]